MSDQREVFTILEDFSTSAGVRLPARAEGDTAGDNHVPSVVAKDSSGNYKLLETRDEGDSSTGVDILPAGIAKDLSGNFKLLETRDEGDAISGVDALPGLVAKDQSGNFAYLNVNADGELVISNEPLGTPFSGSAKVTPGALNVAEDVVTLTLNNTKVYENIMAIGSSTFPVRWELFQIDDAAGTPTETDRGSWITGPGKFTFKFDPELLKFTSGGTGVIELVLRGTQLTGALSDMHGYAECFEKA